MMMNALKKKLSDWKFWIFGILPSLRLAGCIALTGYGWANHITDYPLAVFAQYLLVTAMLLFSCPRVVTLFRQKHLLRAIFSLACILIFLGLEIATMALLPKLFELSNEERRLRDEYLESSFDDESFHEKHDAWYEAYDDVADLNFTLEFMNLGGILAIALSPVVMKPNKKEESGQDAPAEPTGQTEPTETEEHDHE